MNSPNDWIEELKIKKSGDVTSSTKENSWGEAPISMEGRKIPAAVQRIRSENTKRSKVSLDVHEICFIFFVDRTKNGIIQGNIPAATARMAIRILTF
jgi:hypothetical protein